MSRLLLRRLASGDLVGVWEAVSSATSYWLVGAENSADDPRISAFRSWILNEAAAS